MKSADDGVRVIVPAHSVACESVKARMYLLPIHVPIYLDGDRKFVTTEWWRSLELLRDSFAGRFGQIVAVAPTLPADTALDQRLVEHSHGRDEIELVPGFDLRCRAREYWTRRRANWSLQLRELIRQADVVHAGLDDVYRPIAFEGVRLGLRARKPTVFVQDTDIVVQQRQLAADGGPAARLRASAYVWMYERLCRWSVARADLSLLKGSTLIARYGRYAHNPKQFHDTSFSAANIIAPERLEQRLATLRTPRPLQLVYCGRLTRRKGVDMSLQILARAIGLGAAFRFDVIGDGRERSELERQASSLGISDHVRFLGSLPYDAALLSRLGSYDALLFTPLAEDTPRMIFDGYAAALPLIAFDIGYTRERQQEEHAALLLPSGDVEQSARTLLQLHRDCQRLAPLARNARCAADYHCAEHWYRRRAEWTIEAVERHNACPTVAVKEAA